MKKFYLIFAFGLPLLTACSSEEQLFTADERVPIHVRPVLTRATETSLKGLKNDGFNLSAIWEGQLYMNQVGYTYGGGSNNDESSTDESSDNETGSWSGNGQYFWPKGAENTTLKFYGYSPGSLSDKVTIDADQQVITDFVPNASIANQVDLVTAYATGSKQQNADTEVQLNFLHRLSQVKVQATNSNKEYTYKITGVRIGNVKEKGTLSLPANEEQNVQNDWSTNGVGVTKYSILYEDNPITLGIDSEGNPATTNSLMSTEGNAMLVPQSNSAWVPNPTATSTGTYIAVLLQITHTASSVQIYPFDNMLDSDGQTRKYAWAAIPVDINWSPNNKYVYTLQFGEGAGYVGPEPGYDNVGEPILKLIKIKVTVEPWTPDPLNTDVNMKPDENTTGDNTGSDTGGENGGGTDGGETGDGGTGSGDGGN